MATLAVWKFDTPSGAVESAKSLQALARQDIAVLRDAATVSWERTRKKPKTRQLTGTAVEETSAALSGDSCSG